MRFSGATKVGCIYIWKLVPSGVWTHSPLAGEILLSCGAIQGKSEANQTHFEVGHAVRAFIIEQGNTPPEQLPTPEVSIQELRRREQQRIEAERQPSLLPPDETDDQ